MAGAGPGWLPTNRSCGCRRWRFRIPFHRLSGSRSCTGSFCRDVALHQTLRQPILSLSVCSPLLRLSRVLRVLLRLRRPRKLLRTAALPAARGQCRDPIRHQAFHAKPHCAVRMSREQRGNTRHWVSAPAPTELRATADIKPRPHEEDEQECGSPRARGRLLEVHLDAQIFLLEPLAGLKLGEATPAWLAWTGAIAFAWHPVVRADGQALRRGGARKLWHSALPMRGS